MTEQRVQEGRSCSSCGVLFMQVLSHVQMWTKSPPAAEREGSLAALAAERKTSGNRAA